VSLLICSSFLKSLSPITELSSCSPESWWDGMGPVVSKKRFEKGGHFAAWERPGDLVGCLEEMFGKGGPCENVVKGSGALELRVSCS